MLGMINNSDEQKLLIEKRDKLIKERDQLINNIKDQERKMQNVNHQIRTAKIKIAVGCLLLLALIMVNIFALVELNK
jgi:adenylate kinase